MKVIKYNLCSINENGDELLFPVSMDWNEVNEEIAKREAHNGTYTIEDDGRAEEQPSSDDILRALLGV